MTTSWNKITPENYSSGYSNSSYRSIILSNISKPISSQNVQDLSQINENWDESQINKDANDESRKTDTKTIDHSSCSSSDGAENIEPIVQSLEKMGNCLGTSQVTYQQDNNLVLKLVAEYIKSGNCHNVICLTGAGISTSAGIPDFRSPETGLYATLADKHPELGQPEDIFSIDFFRENPTPFFKRAKELMQLPGEEKYKPTPSHYFVKHLSDRGLLLRNYTQNIDGLERKAGIPEEKLIEAHGSFDTAHCISRECLKVYSKGYIQDLIKRDIVPTCSECNDLVKPDIVFFGESLPERFFESIDQDFEICDMLIIMGTSLEIHPFVSLVEAVHEECPVLFINMVNSAPWIFNQQLANYRFEGANRKVFWQGNCDDGCTQLEQLMGWTTEY